ncbi:MAG: acyltransferase, partial [Burkholderiales bacterium]
FSISGYLVWISWSRSPTPADYIVNRALRIYPGLAVVVLLAALVLGPLVTGLPLAAYLGNELFWSYLAHNLTPWGFASYLPGVFEANPLPRVVNMPLWTIPYEILMYGAVVVVGWVGARRTVVVSWIAFGLLAAVHAWNTFDHDDPWLVGARSRYVMGYELESVSAFGSFFWSGVLFAHYRNRIRMRGAYAFIALVVLLASAPTRAFVPVAWAALPYLLLYLAFAPAMSALPDSRNDYSYGIYLYAWPVQQTVATLLPDAGAWGLSLAVSLLATTACAVFSWHVVEQPALGLKRRLTTRRAPAPSHRA